MGLVTLSQMNAQVRQLADVVSAQGQFPDAEINSYINNSFQKLYDKMVGEFGEDYFVASPYSLNILPGQDTYPLPGVAAAVWLPLTTYTLGALVQNINGVYVATSSTGESAASGGPSGLGTGIVDGTVTWSYIQPFYKIMGVDVALNSSTNLFISIKRFNFNERNLYNWTPVAWNTLGVANVMYRLQGGNIRFVPGPVLPSAIARIWYIPQMPLLVNPTDSFDGVNGWEQYVILDAAIKVRIKEQNEVADLVALKEDELARITASMRNRDAGAPPTVTDVNKENSFPLSLWGSW